MRWWVGLQYTTQGLVNDIEARKNKISILDMTAFSYEHGCKRTEQQIQELSIRKDRLENWSQIYWMEKTIQSYSRSSNIFYPMTK